MHLIQTRQVKGWRDDPRPICARDGYTNLLFYCRPAVSPLNTTLTREKVQITKEFRKEAIVFDLDRRYYFLDHERLLLTDEIVCLLYV